MTRAQFVAILVASGVSFTAGATLDFNAGPPASAVFVHALRIEADKLVDGGLSADRIVAYRTKVTQADDGGVDLDDLGPASCSGDTSPARTWVRNNCQTDAGAPIGSVYVIEARTTGADDGGAGDVLVDVYGDTFQRCALPKPVAFRNFLSSLTCVGLRPRPSTNPL